LLEYYSHECQYPVFRLKKNIGYTALWDSGLYNKFKHSYYVYTDSDMQIDKNCPNDFMKLFLDLLERYKNCYKVGFGLRIDDIPDHYKSKDEVIKHEEQFWKKEIEPGLYDAIIDTTFALYKPYTKGPGNNLKFNIRTGKPYVIRHLPWYSNSSQLTEEDIYYIKNTRTSTHWTEKANV